jgi:dolichol-phosphate mannosyltransferase
VILTNNKISVILPTYNEEDNILPLIEAVIHELNDFKYEVIIVDDGSDSTFKKVNERALPFVRSVKRSAEKGLANSVRFGIENTDGDIIVVMDSDFNHKPEYLREMVAGMSENDCVSASRFIRGGGMDSFLRYQLSGLYNRFIRFMIDGSLTDYLFGFFAVKRAVLDRRGYDAVFYGFGDYFMRLMCRLERSNAKILEIPARHGLRKHGKSSNRIWRTFINYSVEVFKLAGSLKVKTNV